VLSVAYSTVFLSISVFSLTAFGFSRKKINCILACHTCTLALYRLNNKKMEVKIVDSAAYEALMAKIDSLIEQASTSKKEDWLDNSDVCKLLKISKRTLQNYRDNGKIPYYKIEGKILYKFSEIESAFEKHSITSQQ
jgi:hypothetical protein